MFGYKRHLKEKYVMGQRKTNIYIKSNE